MKTETTPTENRIIAEFMGYEVINYQHSQFNPIYNGHKSAQTIEQQKELWNGLELQFTGRFVSDAKFPFKTDFNYLIPIIRKIEEMGFVVLIAGIKYQVYRILEENNPIIGLVCGDLSKKTEMVCDLIIRFIEWCNTQKH